MDNKSTTGTDAIAANKNVTTRKKPQSFNKKRFREIFEKISKNDIELSEQIRSGDYFKINESQLRQRAPKDNDNILHLLADEYQEDEEEKEATDEEDGLGEDYEDVGDVEKNGPKKPVDSQSLMKEFVSCLLHNFEDLMLETGHKQRTPLFVAIERGLENMVNWMLEYRDIAKVLEMTDSSGENCVHAALTSNLPRDIIIRLINKSTKKALKAKDERDRTPFYLAVEYKRCRQGQLEVSEALIKKGTDALDVHAKHPTRMSVYQYHNHTRRDYKASLKKFQGTDGRNSQRGPTEGTSHHSHGPSQRAAKRAQRVTCKRDKRGNLPTRERSATPFQE